MNAQVFSCCKHLGLNILDDVEPTSSAYTTPSTREEPPEANGQTTPHDTFLAYKCDYCRYHNVDAEDVNQHLISAKHFSASLYKALKVRVS